MNYLYSVQPLLGVFTDLYNLSLVYVLPVLPLCMYYLYKLLPFLGYVLPVQCTTSPRCMHCL